MEMSLGTLKDINANLLNSEPKLSKKNILKQKEKAKEFILKKNQNYYMLLNHDRRDFTLFNFKNGQPKNLVKDLFECMQNRGDLVAFSYETDAIEIWIRIDDILYCYCFFGYDGGVIEVK